jgi:hypothetical protein
LLGEVNIFFSSLNKSHGIAKSILFVCHISHLPRENDASSMPVSLAIPLLFKSFSRRNAGGRYSNIAGIIGIAKDRSLVSRL